MLQDNAQALQETLRQGITRINRVSYFLLRYLLAPRVIDARLHFSGRYYSGRYYWSLSENTYSA